MMSFTRTSTVVSFIVSFYVLCILPSIVVKCVVKITLVRSSIYSGGFGAISMGSSNT